MVRQAHQAGRVWGVGCGVWGAEGAEGAEGAGENRSAPLGNNYGLLIDRFAISVNYSSALINNSAAVINYRATV